MSARASVSAIPHRALLATMASLFAQRAAAGRTSVVVEASATASTSAPAAIRFRPCIDIHKARGRGGRTAGAMMRAGRRGDDRLGLGIRACLLLTGSPVGALHREESSRSWAPRSRTCPRGAWTGAHGGWGYGAWGMQCHASSQCLRQCQKGTRAYDGGPHHTRLTPPASSLLPASALALARTPLLRLCSRVPLVEPILLSPALPLALLRIAQLLLADPRP
jgi:hypothetical protein